LELAASICTKFCFLDYADLFVGCVLCGCQGGMAGEGSDDDDDDVGPQPLDDGGGKSGPTGKTNFGGALLPGEGEAIAQYAEKNMRIPRRGEVGWQGDEIEQLENLGYVMSGK